MADVVFRTGVEGMAWRRGSLFAKPRRPRRPRRPTFTRAEKRYSRQLPSRATPVPADRAGPDCDSRPGRLITSVIYFTNKHLTPRPGRASGLARPLRLGWTIRRGVLFSSEEPTVN